ncbi:MAG: hypothetical protein GY724_28155 [Actinomycetia bacterium]|nr:hypothetical protein [Actinomycetes bacterium]MCP4223516.1 hypothetical protein [Actinomycetes bacterium]MCP5033708.1 hypothetical protein [Actinomycetes bacterium]
MRSTRRARLVVGLGMSVAVAISGCTGDIEEGEYGQGNREAFLAACTETSEDPRLIRDVCECTYEEIRATFTLSELAALEESLKLNSLASLPEAVAAVMADCFVAEADL